MDLDWHDIQGNVLRGYGFDHARHLVLRVDRAADGRAWLGRIAAAVTPGRVWRDRPVSTLNVAFTAAGLAALGVGEAIMRGFPPEFVAGMAARAGALGDVGDDDPAGWEPAGPHQPGAHVLVMVHAPAAADCEAAADAAADAATAAGLAVLARQPLTNLHGPDGDADPMRVEHFGFADGVSQPAIEGALAPTTVPGNGTFLGEGRWRPVRPGEFVVGYPDEEEDAPPLPGPARLVRNGTFLVWRKLAQDVAGFRRFLAERAAVDDPGGAARLGAQLVGRWPDGSPYGDALADPTRGDATRAAPGPGPAGGDAALAACPAGSHIRRANPTGSLPAVRGLVSRHRLLRRGMPYGPPLPPGVSEDDGVARGLVFVAYCASIRRQFEFVQREWLNDGNAVGAGHTTDPITGAGGAWRRFAVPGPRPRVLGDLPRFVRTRGGAYLFQPSLAALHDLAHGRWLQS
jgi:Dyp-type peroxidase family